MIKGLSLNINYQNRVYGLDILRAIAILIVMLGHGSPLLKNTSAQEFPFISLVDGVELFFVLSGFLIGGILLREIESHSFGIKELIHFWKRRWFRTLPNYYLILIVNIALVYYGLIPGNKEKITIDFVFFTQNFKEPLTDFFWESWSLSIEEWFYLLFGVGVFVSIKLLKPVNAYLVCSLLLILLPLFYRISISEIEVDYFWWDVTFRKTVLCRLDAIGFGVLAAYLYKYKFSFWIKYKNIFFCIGGLTLIGWPYLEFVNNTFFSKTFYFTTLSFAAALLLPFFSQIKQGSGTLFKIFTYTSLLSYSLYLINLSIVEQLIATYIPFNGIINYLLFWFLCFVIAYILYRFYEKPMMDLREK